MAQWIKRKNALIAWNECSHCGYKSISTVFGDEIKPATCPGCGLIMTDFKEKKDDYDPRKLPIIGACRRFSRDCIRGENCVTCGWNETEFQRRIHSPWKTNKMGLKYLDISWSKEAT